MPISHSVGKQEKRTALHAIFDFKLSFLKKVHEIKKKSPCLGDSKHIFKLKIAQVVPIFKSGSHTDINNYRPISLFCSFSKILEKIVAGRLLKYLNSNNLISPNQFGFRAKHATVHPMFKLINSAANAINN
jgi:hypothetical protein